LCPLQFPDLRNVTLSVELPSDAGEQHISHLSEHRTLELRAILLADEGPSKACVTLGVSYVKLITIIEPNVRW